MTERARSIIGIMMIITLLSGVFLFWGINRYKKTMNESILDTTDKTGRIIRQVIDSTNLIYDFHINNLLKNKSIVEAFKQRDREALYNATLPDHLGFKNENPYYSNMQFHLPDGLSFLRMHKPEAYGDDLTELRPIINHVRKTLKPFSGYEVGRHGFFYRVVKPVFADKEFLGTLEVGIKVEEAAKKIESVMGLSVARYIPDEYLNDDFRRFCVGEIRVNSVSINPYHNRALFLSLAGSYDFKSQKPQFLDVGDHHYLVFSAGNLNEYDGKHISRFLIVQDIQKAVHDYHRFIIASVVLTVLLISSAFVVLYFSFGSMIDKIIELNRDLESKVKQRTRDLEETTKKLIASHADLDQIINTAADGMRVIGMDYTVLRVNETFAKMAGRTREELENKPCHASFTGPHCLTGTCTLNRILNGETTIELDMERQAASGTRSFLLTATPYRNPDGDVIGVVENFKDITERNNAYEALKENEANLKRHIEKQAVDIKKAKGIMTLINRSSLYYKELPRGRRLFCKGISIPCNEEGGDHFFIRHIPESSMESGDRTLLSMKDQSGHEVNCILRSIYTDLVHHASLIHGSGDSLAMLITKINKRLCSDGFFEPDDFFTSINADINHNTCEMTYLSTGHPPFLLIRDGHVSALPETGNPGCNLPVPFLDTARFTSEMLQLESDDQLLFYTDGLTDMTIGHTHRGMSTRELVTCVQGIVDDYYANNNRHAPVSDIADALLQHLSRTSDIVLKPGDVSHPGENSSHDDVTLMWLQIETMKNLKTYSLFARTSNELSSKLDQIYETIIAHIPCDLHRQKIIHIRMALEEAVVNAFKHGNRKNPANPVTIRCYHENGLYVDVKDEGNGFDNSTLPDPTRDENRLLLSGRGIFIIRTFADEVWWSEEGRRIHMFFDVKNTKPVFKPFMENSLWKGPSH